MAIRVAAQEVLDLIETSLDEQVILNSMITTASLIVDEQLVGITPVISTGMLKQIELYLATHFVALVEEKGSLKGESFGDAKVFLADVYKAGFSATRFGQVAITLDTSGKLAAISAPQLKAEFRIIG